jgi:hypothetical protein
VVARIEPTAIGRKKHQSDTSSIIIEIVCLEGLEIN